MSVELYVISDFVTLKFALVSNLVRYLANLFVKLTSFLLSSFRIKHATSKLNLDKY